MTSITPGPTIIVVNNNDYIKAGYADENVEGPGPSCTIPALVGTPRPGFEAHYYHHYAQTQHKMLEVVVGWDALHNSLTVEMPFTEGRVQNWDDMKALWEHVFTNELNVDLQPQAEDNDYRLIITETIMAVQEERDEMTRIMFEKFNFQAVAVVKDAELAAYAEGGGNGVMVNFGDNNIAVVPVVNGEVPVDVIQSSKDYYLSFGDFEIATYFKSLLAQGGTVPGILNDDDGMDMVRSMKEELCYVALDYDEEEKKEVQPVEYELLDGSVIHVGKERFQALEAYFQPEKLIYQEEDDGVHTLVSTAINKQGSQHRDALFANIIMCGNPAKTAGLRERLEKEVSSMNASRSVEVKLDVDAVFKGGVKLAACWEEFQPKLVTRK